MASIKDAMKASASKSRTIIETSEETRLRLEFNKLFYLDKNIKEETKFVNTVMTRGEETQERKGLHSSVILDSDKKHCLRQHVLSLHYKQRQGEQVNIDLMRIFEEGNAIHEKWQRLFIRGGFGSTDDMDTPSVDERYSLIYTPDAKIIVPGFFDDKPFIVEIKSMRSFAYTKSTGHSHGENQANMYMYYEKCRNAVVLCENKDTQEFRLHIRQFNKEKARPYVNRLKEINEADRRFIEVGKPPDRHCDCGRVISEKAEKCPMRDSCWNCGMGRVKLED